MTTAHALIRVAVCLAFVACAQPALAADASSADAADCASPAYSQMQLRLVDRAAQGPDALRRYVGIVQPIQQIGFVEAVAWIDSERQRLDGCRSASLRRATASR